MNDISRQELHDIALIAGLEINDEECAVFAQEIQSVLAYIEELTSIEITQSRPSNDIQQPILREDVACTIDEAYQTQAQQLVQNAPVHENRYFVVPQMVRKSKG